MIPSDLFFWGSLAFIAGVAGASIDWNIYLLLCGIAAIALTARFFERQPTWGQTFLLLALATLGAWYFHFSENNKERQTRIVFNEPIVFSAILREVPRSGEDYRVLGATLEPPYSGKIRIVAPALTHLSYGDYVEASGTLREPRSTHDVPTTLFPRIFLKERHRGFWLKERLYALKERFIDSIISPLPSDEGALLAGITVGERAVMNREFKAAMTDSGTIHLVALSGYNIAILTSAVGRVLRGHLSKRKNFFLTGFLILLFVLMVGAEASIVRAAIMGILVLLAQELGRLYNPRNAIALAAALMTLAAPTAPVYDLGFQLSFTSLIGIVYLAPLLRNALNMRDEGFLGWKFNATTTVAAQCMVLPILLGNFGSLPLFGAVANIVILQLVPFTMFVGFIQGFAGMLSAYAGYAIAKLAHVLTAFEVGTITGFARISMPLELRMGFATAATYYTILLAGITLVLRKSPSRQLLEEPS